MRIVKSLQDVQKVLNEILDWKERWSSQNIDLHGHRMMNAGDSTAPQDYVTRNELQAALKTSPGIQAGGAIYYTIAITPPDGQVDGAISPSFIVGIGKSGVPNQFWLMAEDPPTGSDLVVNIQYNNVNLLVDDLHFKPTDTVAVFTSNFVTPVPFIGVGGKVNLKLVNVNSAARINAGLVVRQG